MNYFSFTARYSDGELGVCSKEKGQEDIKKCAAATSDGTKNKLKEGLWFSAYCKQCDGQETTGETRWYFRDHEMQMVQVQGIKYVSTFPHLGVSGGRMEDGSGFELVKNFEFTRSVARNSGF